jgi:hypothetical protein
MSSYEVYKSVWWQSPNLLVQTGGGGGGGGTMMIYEPYLLYWLALPSLGYSCASQAPVLFLTLDRICALRYSTFFTKLRKSNNQAKFKLLKFNL